MATIEVEPSKSGSGLELPPANTSPLLTLQAQRDETSDIKEKELVAHNYGGGKTRGPRPELPLYWHCRTRPLSPENDDDVNDDDMNEDDMKDNEVNDDDVSDEKMSEADSESTIHPDESLMQDIFNEKEPTLVSYFQHNIESKEYNRNFDSELTKDAIDGLEEEYANVLDPKRVFFNFKCEGDRHDIYTLSQNPAVVSMWFYSQKTSVLKEFVQFVAKINTVEAAQMKVESEALIHLAERLQISNAFRQVEEKLQSYHERYEAELIERATTDISAALSLQFYNTKRPDEPDRTLPIGARALVQQYQRLYGMLLGEHEFMMHLQRELSEHDAKLVFFEMRGYHYDPTCTGGTRPYPINLEFDNLQHSITELEQSEVHYPELGSAYRPGLYSYDRDSNAFRYAVLERNSTDSNYSTANDYWPSSPSSEIQTPVRRGRGRPRKELEGNAGTATINQGVLKKPKTPRDSIIFTDPRETKHAPPSTVSNRTPVHTKDLRNIRIPVRAQRPVRSSASPELKALSKFRAPPTPTCLGNFDTEVDGNARFNDNSPSTLATSKTPPQDYNMISNTPIPDPIRRRFSPSPSPVLYDDSDEEDSSALG